MPKKSESSSLFEQPVLKPVFLKHGLSGSIITAIPLAFPGQDLPADGAVTINYRRESQYNDMWDIEAEVEFRVPDVSTAMSYLGKSLNMYGQIFAVTGSSWEWLDDGQIKAHLTIRNS